MAFKPITIPNLPEFQSTAAVAVQVLGPGTYTQPLPIQGNSLLSSLFIDSMDAGASIKVNYWDSGAGVDLGERYDLQSHPLLTGVTRYTDRQTVSRIHNKPNIEMIITGGNVKFGIYVTVVSAFANDSGAALIANFQDVSDNDRGTPQVLIDPVTGKWQFASGVNGVQNVSIDNAISTSDLIVSGRQVGRADSLLYGSSTNLLSFTATAQVKLPKILVGGGSDGLFSVMVRGEDWGTFRNSWGQRQLSLDIGTIILEAGETLSITVQNLSLSGNDADYYAYAYTGT